LAPRQICGLLLRAGLKRQMAHTPEAAKSCNNQLRRTVVAVAGASADGHPYGFLCECGCGATVSLVLADYDLQGGAWPEGHSPPRGRPS
jgi:hypothetical protein